jgi:hypothetical protein
VAAMGDVCSTLFTTCPAVPELAAKPGVPSYQELSVLFPAEIDLSEQEPKPPTSPAEQAAPAPSLTVTVPVAVPAPGATTAAFTWC